MGLPVLIVDDFGTTRAGVRAVVESDPTFEVIGEASTGPAALEMLGALRPRVVVLDLGVPGVSGTTLVSKMRKEDPELRILVQTMQDDEEIAVSCLDAGANGFVLKQDPPDTLLEGLRAVVAGERFVSPSLSVTAMDSADRRRAIPKDALASLSVRETQVLRFTAQGLSSRETAVLLGISPRTVEAHRGNLMTKLNLKNNRELVRYAFQRGIIA